MDHVKLSDLYKVTENLDGSITFNSDEVKRFEQNFRDILEIKYCSKYNPHAQEMYDKLCAYSKWFNKL